MGDERPSGGFGQAGAAGLAESATGGQEPASGQSPESMSQLPPESDVLDSPEAHSMTVTSLTGRERGWAGCIHT